MMRRTYQLVGWGIVLLGTVHMLAAMKIFDGLTPRALWFVGSGAAMVLLGALNLLNHAYGTIAPGIRRVAAAANIAMLVFGAIAGVVTRSGLAEFLAVVGLLGSATVMSMLRQGLISHVADRE